MSHCGSCNVCCTVMGVDEIDKAPGDKCVHLCGKGCSIYQFRPQSCRAFECLWLQMQASEKPLPKNMRPDRCGVMFVPSPITDVIAAHCTSEAVFDAKPVGRHVMRWMVNGIKFIRIVGDRRTVIGLEAPRDIA